MKRNGVLGALFDVITHNKLVTTGVAVAVAGSVAAALLPPLALERVVDALATGGDVPFLWIAVYFALLAASGLFDTARESLITVFGQRVTHALRSRMCQKLSRISAQYAAQNEPGAVVSCFVGDVDTVEALFTSGVIGMFADACKVLGVFFVIFSKSVGLGVLLVAVMPPMFLFTRRIQKRMLAAQTENRAAAARISGRVPEAMENIRMIHCFHKEAYMLRRYDRCLRDRFIAMERASFCEAVYSPVVLLVSAVIVSVTMCLASAGGEMQRFFGISVGTAVAVIAYIGKVFGPVESIGMEIQTVQTAVAGVRRINALLDAPERSACDSSVDAETLIRTDAPCVAFDRVDFAYDGGSPVLREMSFTVGRGESVTLFGRTGAGKSTSLKLILGLYEPQRGSVRIFGTDAARIPDAQKRRLFGYVEQSFFMVSGTVLEQITLFDGGITRDAALQALRTVGLSDTVAALPMGVDTPCTEALFSQGQWQLMSVARAIVAEPPILLFDEITANLDSDTERAVLTALERASENRTVLSVSHRLYQKTGGRRIEIRS